MKRDAPKLNRPCKKCGELFIPTGKTCRICNDCYQKSRVKPYTYKKK